MHSLTPDKSKKEINLISFCKHLACMVVIAGMGGLAYRREGEEKLMSQTSVLS